MAHWSQFSKDAPAPKSEQDKLQAEITRAVEKGLVEAMRPLLDVPPFHVLRHLPPAALNSMAVAATATPYRPARW